jgi:hypothetical protein
LLAIWLILMGLISLIPAINFPGMNVIMAIIALIDGICLLVDK